MTADAAYLKSHGKHYYDFSVHFMEVLERGPYEKNQISYWEPHIVADRRSGNTNFAKHSRLCQCRPRTKVRLTNDPFLSHFTTVTKVSPIMVRIDEASLSRYTHTLVHTCTILQ